MLICRGGGNSTWWNLTRIIFRPFYAFFIFGHVESPPPPVYLNMYGLANSTWKIFWNGQKIFWVTFFWTGISLGMSYTLFRHSFFFQPINPSKSIVQTFWTIFRGHHMPYRTHVSQTHSTIQHPNMYSSTVIFITQVTDLSSWSLTMFLH